MNVKQIVGTTVELIVKVVIFVFIIMFVYRTAVAAYDYGYRVFAEEPVSQGEGRTLSVYVEDTASVRDIGDMLQEKGLIRDGRLFWIQEMLSENHGKIKPGIYDLNTSMTSQEMIAVMAGTDEETADDTTAAGSSQPGEAADQQTQQDEAALIEENAAIGAEEGTGEGAGEGE